MEEKLTKYFSGEASDPEKQEILTWRSENPEAFLQYKSVWASMHRSNPTNAGLSEIIGGGREAKEVKFTPWLRYAATIALVIAGVLGIYYFTANSTTTYQSSVSELPDGTTAILYKDAQMTHESTDTERRVKMDGRVYFDVERMEDKPFVIETDEAVIEVLGTSFLVNSEEDNVTTVVVESGTVAFYQNPEAYNGRITRVTLKAGEMGIISPNAKGVVKRNNRDENYLAWANQILRFQRTNLKDAGSLIEEVYGYKVSFDNANLNDCLLTATYKKKSPEEIADLIARTFDLSYEVTESREIVFSGTGCN